MYEEIFKWAGLVNLVLLIPILFRAPRAIRLGTEADLLRQKAALLNAEIEIEKVTRGITYADYQRDLSAAHDKLMKLYSQLPPAKEQPPSQ